jgi:hypothetical protein
MSIGLKSDSNGTSGSIVINGSDKVVVTSAGNVTAGTFTGAVVGSVTGNVTGNVNGTLTNGGSLNLATTTAATSGTAIDFTGIPSWVKRVTVMFNGVSISGTSGILVQLGTSSGVTTTGYLSTAMDVSGSGITGLSSTAGMVIRFFLNSYGVIGSMLISTLNSNVWVAAGTVGRTTQDSNQMLAGNVTLGGTLDRVRITTVNGTDTFDAGSVNIMYEG